MAEIAKIKLPSGVEYEIKDETARAMTLEATYTSATHDLALSFVSAASADSNEY